MTQSSLERPVGQHRVVSFFSGCGGLDLGFRGGFNYQGTSYRQLPFALQRAYDFSARAVATYNANVGDHAEVMDLGRVRPSAIPGADVLLGGFPCQEFSTCGPRKGLESERGRLYLAMVRYAAQHLPKLIVAENVANLLYINDGWDFSVIKSQFKRIGYRCVTWKVNAADFGVPQNRHRVFVIFVRQDMPADPHCPEAPFLDKHRSAKWALEDLEGVNDETVPNQSQYFRAAKATGGHGQGDETTPIDAPSYTVRANARSRIQFHYSLPRRLTVRECARLQTFPDSFSFPHPATQAIIQIGNAVPPVLAHHVASRIADYLGKIDGWPRQANEGVA